MTGFVFRRLVQAIVLIKCVLIFVFLLLHLTGDPLTVMAPDDATQEDLMILRQQMGFDKPLVVQYARFFAGAVQGDFGKSWDQGEPALKVVLERMPATIQLALTAFLMSVLIGIPLGCLAALKENTAYDQSLMAGSVFGQAVPNFWLALMLILFFSVYLRWLPSFGRGGLSHLIMPAFTAATFHIARLARLMRSEMLEALRQDYVLTARAKGVRERLVVFRHALKNCSIPIVTLLGIDLGLLLGGTVIIETVFAWPGVGRLTVQSIHNRDFPVVQVSVFLLASIFVIVNLIVDILYKYLDPRIEYR